MAIWGDAIDNVPGVPGIGEKGAKSLISEFGWLDGVYENLDKLKPAQRKKLEEHKDKAYMSRELAQIKCDLEYDVDFDTLKMQEPDRAKLHDVFSRLEFASLMQEFLPEAPPVEREYRIAEKGEDVRDFVKGDAPIAIWVEPDLGAALSVCRGESLLVTMSNESVAAALRELLESDRLFVAHDAKLQCRRLHAAG